MCVVKYKVINHCTFYTLTNSEAMPDLRIFEKKINIQSPEFARLAGDINFINKTNFSWKQS